MRVATTALTAIATTATATASQFNHVWHYAGLFTELILLPRAAGTSWLCFPA
ncbi:hypothetical protein A2U01_0050560 [Trifolium medium]|uniref:Uncharacterized protein n=1 Tax=Trifolium medium TaxID=97028 RepID=A0A392QYC3_9FABA|nr:hypothetical protein [Trifolium medium]